MLSKVLSILFNVYSTKWLKVAVSVQDPRKKKNPSQLLQSKEHTVRGRETERGGWGWGGWGVGGLWAEEGEGKRQRFSSNEYLVGVLLESWLVCSSINSWILCPSILLQVRSEKKMSLQHEACPGLLSEAANWIQLDWPHIFSSSQLWPNPSDWALWHVFKCYASYYIWKKWLLGTSSKSVSLTLDKAVLTVQHPQKTLLLVLMDQGFSNHINTFTIKPNY